MKKLFDAIEVTPLWNSRKYKVEVSGAIPEIMFGAKLYQLDEWREDVRRFIRDAIHEKMARVAAGGKG